MNCPCCGEKIEVKLLGQRELADQLGWDPRRLGLYKQRGELPEPDFEPACGPVWFENNKELQEFLTKYKKPLAGGDNILQHGYD